MKSSGNGRWNLNTGGTALNSDTTTAVYKKTCKEQTRSPGWDVTNVPVIIRH